MPHRLLALAAALPPPFVLLEDGRGDGTALLAWGASERLRLDWDAAALGTLDRLDPGDGWIGAIGYDLGLPPRAERRAPMIAQPVVDLFRPVNRIVLRPGVAPELRGPDAAAAWDAVARAPFETVDPAAVAAALRSGDPGLAGLRPVRARLGDPPDHPHRPPGPVAERSFDQPAFEAAVRRVLEHIRAGDIYQANLSVAERVAVREPPLDIYRRLRAINPSPWMGYADFGDWQLVCGSPELLVEVRGREALARPIAGTRKKTGDAAHDAAMRVELLADAKEAAEHVMLVDLARNDLGRIAEFGSVRVERQGVIEEYSHVMHLVSDVRARLTSETTPLGVFRALFPGGTITGTPKIRAMEIIAELEPVARGMYTGALGWWEGDTAQWNILIRSAVVRGGEAVIQAGAGIVADSDPTREWKESLRKAAALREAFGAGSP